MSSCVGGELTLPRCQARNRGLPCRWLEPAPGGYHILSRAFQAGEVLSVVSFATVPEGRRLPPNKVHHKQIERYPVDVLERIKQLVEQNPIIIFMKGTPQFPMCGFSSRAAAALQDCGVEFAYVNVLSDQEIFQNLPRFADWPTFPQVYIKGELIGGCDITLELHGNGELQKMTAEAAKAAS